VQSGHDSWVMEQMGIRGGELKEMDHGKGAKRKFFFFFLKKNFRSSATSVRHLNAESDWISF
jgi:hypothetical protein